MGRRLGGCVVVGTGGDSFLELDGGGEGGELGFGEGDFEGGELGFEVGVTDGLVDGDNDGEADGFELGLEEGNSEGWFVEGTLIVTASIIGSSKDPEVAPAPISDSSSANKAFSCKAVSKIPLSISLARLVVTSSYIAVVCSEHSSPDEE